MPVNTRLRLSLTTGRAKQNVPPQEKASRRRGMRYCGATENLTEEHGPPRSLFPDPKPNNLVNAGDSPTLRHLLTAPDARGPMVGRAGFELHPPAAIVASKAQVKRPLLPTAGLTKTPFMPRGKLPSKFELLSELAGFRVTAPPISLAARGERSRRRNLPFRTGCGSWRSKPAKSSSARRSRDANSSSRPAKTVTSSARRSGLSSTEFL
jgi:hypothetical protein